MSRLLEENKISTLAQSEEDEFSLKLFNLWEETLRNSRKKEDRNVHKPLRRAPNTY